MIYEDLPYLYLVFWKLRGGIGVGDFQTEAAQQFNR